MASVIPGPIESPALAEARTLLVHLQAAQRQGLAVLQAVATDHEPAVARELEILNQTLTECRASANTVVTALRASPPANPKS